jgi:hypothetical protein
VTPTLEDLINTLELIIICGIIYFILDIWNGRIKKTIQELKVTFMNKEIMENLDGKKNL